MESFIRTLENDCPVKMAVITGADSCVCSLSFTITVRHQVFHQQRCQIFFFQLFFQFLVFFFPKLMMYILDFVCTFLEMRIEDYDSVCLRQASLQKKKKKIINQNPHFPNSYYRANIKYLQLCFHQCSSEAKGMREGTYTCSVWHEGGHQFGGSII